MQGNRQLMERVHELTKENLKLKAQLPNHEEFHRDYVETETERTVSYTTDKARVAVHIPKHTPEEQAVYKKQAVLSWIALILSALCLIPQIIILVENVRA